MLILSNRGTSFLICLSFLINLAACSKEEPNPNPSNDSPAIQDARTEPLAFKMTMDSTISLEAPPEEIGKDTLPLRTPGGKPALYGIESARVVLEMKGDKSGVLRRVFKDYGLYDRVVDSTMPVQDRGPNFPNHSLAITTPEFTGIYRYLVQYGWQMPMDYSHYLDSSESKTMSITEFMLLQSEAKRIGDTTINGYHTQVYRFEAPTHIETLWLWRGVPIRIHTFLPLDDLEYYLEPVSIEINPEIPDDAFTFPKNLNIQKRDTPPPPGTIPPPMPGLAPSTQDDGESK